ncbi:MAG: hypothetical protein ACLRTQ_04940 [Candidatus Borkfalkia sp.]
MELGELDRVKIENMLEQNRALRAKRRRRKDGYARHLRRRRAFGYSKIFW